MLFCTVEEFWPRLLTDEKKPTWLKINFDRWKTGDSDSAEEGDGDESAKIQVCV